MTVGPIIERELRAQSRLAFTYWLRVVGAAALLGVCLLFTVTYGLTPSLGGQLFACLHGALFGAIWILVPLLCADCISRERREGTVGLLFLTPLSARDVVLAKGLVHGLRALSLLLAVLPIVTIALLSGGVSGKGIVMSVMMNFSAIAWALAAGIVASSFGKSWARSQLLAGALAVGFGILFLMAAGGNTRLLLGKVHGLPYPAPDNYERTLLVGFLTATDVDDWWGRAAGSRGTSAQSSWLPAQGRIVVVSLLVLALAIELAANNLRRRWREEPPSARQVWIERTFFTPVLWVSFLRGWMRRKLERNPIGWLEQRTWTGRLVTWGWFAVMISVYSAAFTNSDVSRSLDLLQKAMAWLLLGLIAACAAGSLQRERETGLLELLLVSPLSIGQIIGGRLRGLWGQFLPAFVVLLGIQAYLASYFPARHATPGLIKFFCGAFLTLPVIGLYYSLRRSNFISSFLFTLGVGLLAPFALRLVLNFWTEFILGVNTYHLPGVPEAQNDDSLGSLLIYATLRLTAAPFFTTLLQLALAAGIGWRLYYDMKRRNFAFARVVT